MPLQLPPPVTRALLIACSILFFLGAAARPLQNMEFLWLTLFGVSGGGFWPWQIVTYPLVHLDGLAWVFNMMTLYFFGSRLEDLWGLRRYVQFLLACSVTAAAVFLLLSLLVGVALPLWGLSSVIYGMLVAFAMLFPTQRVMFYFIAEMTMRTLVWVVFGMAIIMAIGQSFDRAGAWIGAVAPFGGALGAYLMLLYWRWRPPSFKRKKPPAHIRRVH